MTNLVVILSINIQVNIKELASFANIEYSD